MRFIHLLSVFIVLVLLIPATAPAQKPRPAGQKHTARVLQSFEESLKRIDALLLAQKPKRAYAEAEDLLREMTDRFIDGPDVGSFLGSATVLRAVAAYDLGRENEAIWHWLVAMQMFPEGIDVDLDTYGEAAAFFRAHKPTKKPKIEPGTETIDIKEISTPAVKIKGQNPRIPEAKRHGEPIQVIVRAIIGKDGTLREPKILKSEGELTMVCAVLDAMRQWEYEPSRVEGVGPVEVWQTLVFKYRPSSNSP